MREAFVNKRFHGSSLKIIEAANSIIAEYQAQGFTLTLRQLYYQFVSRDLLPNKQSEYKRLGQIINDGRLAGVVDWDAIEDRTRNLMSVPTWRNPQAAIDETHERYAENFWRGQSHHVEVWVEKDALVGVIEGICNRYRVAFFACRGYTSQSEQYSAGKRLARAADRGKSPVVLHLGDHDPSGIDMTRDNEVRLSMFAEAGVDVRRLALNMDQVRRYRPPPNPAKNTDSRFDDYAKKFGQKCWELDALEPSVIAALIETEIQSVIDQDEWDAAQEREDQNKALLSKTSSEWSGVVDYLNYGQDRKTDTDPPDFLPY